MMNQEDPEPTIATALKLILVESIARQTGLSMGDARHRMQMVYRSHEHDDVTLDSALALVAEAVALP